MVTPYVIGGVAIGGAYLLKQANDRAKATMRQQASMAIGTGSDPMFSMNYGASGLAPINPSIVYVDEYIDIPAPPVEPVVAPEITILTELPPLNPYLDAGPAPPPTPPLTPLDIFKDIGRGIMADSDVDIGIGAVGTGFVVGGQAPELIEAGIRGTRGVVKAGVKTTKTGIAAGRGILGVAKAPIQAAKAAPSAFASAITNTARAVPSGAAQGLAKAGAAAKTAWNAPTPKGLTGGLLKGTAYLDAGLSAVETAQLAKAVVSGDRRDMSKQASDVITVGTEALAQGLAAIRPVRQEDGSVKTDVRILGAEFKGISGPKSVKEAAQNVRKNIKTVPKKIVKDTGKDLKAAAKWTASVPEKTAKAMVGAINPKVTMTKPKNVKEAATNVKTNFKSFGKTFKRGWKKRFGRRRR